MIADLKENEVFVFGSNLEGLHGGGAARQAHEQFGAVWGVGAGLTGQCYAIPTMGGIEQIKLYVAQFLEVAEMLPHKSFLLTKIGCGIAGYSENEIAPLFKNAPENVIKPEGW